MWFKLSKFIFFIFAAGITLTMVACSSSNDITPMTPVKAQSAPSIEPASPLPTPTSLPTEIQEPISPIAPDILPTAIPGGQPPPGSETVLAAAIGDLAQRTGVPPDQITLLSIEAVEWNDASMGCPQEGMMYAQVITPGYKILLQAQGQPYEYHTDQTTTVVLCQP